MKCADIPDVEVLAALRDKYAYTLRPKYPDKLIDAKLRKLERRGLIECGVSLWTSSLTDEGKAILAAAGEATDLPSTLTDSARDWIRRAAR